MVAEVVSVVHARREDKVLVLGLLGDPGGGEAVDGLLALAEGIADGAEETAGLGVGRASASEGFPDGAAVAAPVGDELAAENSLNAL